MMGLMAAIGFAFGEELDHAPIHPSSFKQPAAGRFVAGALGELEKLRYSTAEVTHAVFELRTSTAGSNIYVEYQRLVSFAIKELEVILHITTYCR
jgi:hypothetical protein